VPQHCETDDLSASGFTLRPDEFEAVRRLLYDETGIALGDAKRDMVCSRLAKRLRHHDLTSFTDYLALVRTETAGERQEFINCLTTNKTDFFRESHHFDFLRDTVIPEARAGGRRLRVWSAGCSTGEEPYTRAMTLAEHCPVSDGWDVRVLASDIDTSVLANAERGVYDADRADVPPELLRKYFLRGTGANAGKVAARPVLKERLAFRRINLMDDPWAVRTRFDVIFCRNVVIYFDRDTQRRLLSRFAAHLEPGGYLFMGHSENIHWMADTFAPLGATVYRLRGGAPAARAVGGVPAPRGEDEHTAPRCSKRFWGRVCRRASSTRKPGSAG
jgi:chemotaxis protein methyltransferase CheR